MPFCYNCGVEVEQEERFCANCGSPQELLGLQKQKRKPFVPSLLLLICLLLIGIGFLLTVLNADENSAVSLSKEPTSNIIPRNQDVGQEDEKSASEFNVRGNSPGNTINNAFLAQLGSWLYFQGNDGIYKSLYNGEKLERINYDSEKWAHQINVLGDWVYYISSVENNEIPWNNNGIYRIKLDGSASHKVTYDKAEYMNLIGDWIYYVIEDHEYFGDSSTGYAMHPKYEGIYRIRIDGSEREKIIGAWASSLIVVEDWIYYTNTDPDSFLDWGIYRVRIDGTEHTRITHGTAKYMNIQDSWIYYFHDPSNDREEYWGIYKVKIDGSELTRLTENLACDLNVLGDWIYFVQKGFIYDEKEYGLYKIDLDGDNYTRLESGYFASINIHENWMYLYSIHSEGNMIKKISLDGSEPMPFYDFYENESIEVETEEVVPVSILEETEAERNDKPENIYKPDQGAEDSPSLNNGTFDELFYDDENESGGYWELF